MKQRNSDTSRLLNWARAIENAAFTLQDDILSGPQVEAIVDTSILYGSIFGIGDQKSDTRLIATNRASPITVDSHLRLGEASPVIFIIPPYTAVEIINLLRRRAANLRDISGDVRKLQQIRTEYNRVGMMDTQELSQEIKSLISSVPTSNHDNGVATFVKMLQSPNTRSTTGVFGKDTVIEMHQKSKPLRDRLDRVFRKRDKHEHESSFDFELRNMTDADNIAITVELHKNQKTRNINYSGPIPRRSDINTRDIAEIAEIQRNFLHPFFLLGMFQRNISSDPNKIRSDIAIEASMLADDARKLIENIPSGVEYNNLTSAQLSHVLSLVEEVSYFTKFREEDMNRAQKEHEELISALKSTETAKNAFQNHAEKIEDAADAIFSEFDDLNDDDVLEEFSLREIRTDLPRNGP